MNSYETTFEGKLRKHITEKIQVGSENLWRYPHSNHGDYAQQVGALQACEAILEEMENIKIDIDNGR